MTGGRPIDHAARSAGVNAIDDGRIPSPDPEPAGCIDVECPDVLFLRVEERLRAAVGLDGIHAAIGPGRGVHARSGHGEREDVVLAGIEHGLLGLSGT